MSVDVQRGEAGDRAFSRAFAQVPRAVRAAPFDRFLPGDAHWERQVERAGDAGAFWIAREAGSVVGRIGAFVSPVHAGVGYVGFFEAAAGARAISDPLFAAATEWLRSRGVTRAYGPVDRNTWYSYRYRVGAGAAGEAAPNTTEPFSWEPWQPPSYVEAILAAGFTEARRYRSDGYWRADGVGQAERAEIVRPTAERARALGYRLDPFESDWRQVLPDLHRLGSICFRDNFLFEPLSWEDFEALYSPLGARLDYRTSSWLVGPDGNRVGFNLSFVDRGYATMKTIGILPELRRTGLSLALYWSMLDRALALGVEGGIAALFIEGGASEKMIRAATERSIVWRHHYALYAREL